MRIVLTDKEKQISADLEKKLGGYTFEEIEQALSHLQGVVALQRTERVNVLTFHPKGVDGHE